MKGKEENCLAFPAFPFFSECPLLFAVFALAIFGKKGAENFSDLLK